MLISLFRCAAFLQSIEESSCPLLFPWRLYARDLFIFTFNILSAYDLISRHVVAVMHWSVYLIRHAVAQVSLKIYKLCFKFLKELREC